MQQKKNRGINMKEDSLKHTVGQVSGDKANVCFITAYQAGKTEEENEAANKELEHDIRRLGCGFTKTIGGFQYGSGVVKEEPGFKVGVKEKDPKRFIDEMLALGQKYGQESVLIKVPGKKAAYYNTSDNFGNIDIEFDKASDANPQDLSTWSVGYTQMKKDKTKNPTKAFKLEDIENVTTLTEEEENKLPEENNMFGGRNFGSSSGWIVYRLFRKGLGLEP